MTDYQPPTREQIAEVAEDAYYQARDNGWSRWPNVADAVLALFPRPAPSTEAERTADDEYEGGRADGWAAALDVARAVAANEGDMDYEETNRAAGAVAVVGALEREGEVTPRAAEPPSIAKMAPGTMFRARLREGFGSADRLWFVSQVAHSPVPRVTSTDGERWTASSIDPLTIRDVTPPPAHD